MTQWLWWHLITHQSDFCFMVQNRFKLKVHCLFFIYQLKIIAETRILGSSQHNWTKNFGFGLFWCDIIWTWIKWIMLRPRKYWLENYGGHNFSENDILLSLVRCSVHEFHRYSLIHLTYFEKESIILTSVDIQLNAIVGKLLSNNSMYFLISINFCINQKVTIKLIMVQIKLYMSIAFMY